MPRDGSGVWSPPPGTTASPNTTILSAAYNAFVSDLETDLNAARPIAAGGTGGTSVITGWDGLAAKGSDVASASTINLTTATGPLIDITGTTAVSTVTLAEGAVRLARATGAFLLTAGASLVVNGSTSASYTTTAGDLLLFRGYGSSVVRVWVIGTGSGPAVTTVRTQVFTGSDTYTPHANMVYCIIECVGGGGGGGGAAASGGSVSSSGAGGGAGGYSRKIASKADIGTSQTVTIGALGAGGSTGNNAGSAGGDTSVGALCIAKGGSGGGGASAGGVGARALGGVAGTGDFTPTGAVSNPGGIGVFSGTAGVIAVGSHGASSLYGGGGAGATAGVGAGNGAAATSYGSGGGGGATQNSSGGTAAGGNGSAGVVVITEFCSA